MIDEKLIGKDVEGSGYALIWVTITTFG
jgi:hypothetical protein